MSIRSPIDIIVVPDGFTASGNLRLSLSVSPGRIQQQGRPTAELDRWPSAIAELSRRIHVYRAPLNGASPGPATLLGEWASDLAAKDYHQAATTEWRKIFPSAKVLSDALSVDDLGGFDPDAQGRRQTWNARDSGTIQSQILSEFVKQTQLLVTSEALAARMDGRDREAQSAVPSDEYWALIQDMVPFLKADPVSLLAARDELGSSLREMVERREYHADPARFAGARRGKSLPPAPAAWTEMVASASDAVSKANNLAELRAQQESVASAIVELFYSMGLLDKDEPAKPAEPPEDTPEQRAGRRLAALASYPTLAKFLGFVVDVELPASALGEGIGCISAVFAEPGEGSVPDKPNTWTAYNLAGSHFGPLARAEVARSATSMPPVPQEKGLVTLGAELGGGKKRFALHHVDPVNGIIATTARAQGISDATRSGLRKEEYTHAFPDVGEIGIALVDQEKPRELAEMLGTEPEVSFAEELTRGVRIDCYILPDDEESSRLPVSAERWRPLMGREILFDIDRAFLADDAVKSVAYRDEGFSQPSESIDQKGRVNAPIEVMVWKGEGLGVSPPPPPGVAADPDGLDGNDEIPLSRKIGYPRDKYLQPPPLRLGRGYWFGARACYVNGCGLTVRDARKRYVDFAVNNGDAAAPDSLLLGNGREAYVYGRSRKIPSPVILLPEKSPLVREARMPPGETSLKLVVKSNGEAKVEDHRFVLPGRVPFDTAEQYGQFDDRVGISEDQPGGAFAGGFRLAMDALGNFPIARAGRIVEAEPIAPDDEVTPEPAQDTRGVVAVFDVAAPVRGERYYPDSRARQLAVDATADRETFVSWGNELDFWGQSKAPRDARPLALILRAAGNNAKPLSMSRGRKQVEVKSGDSEKIDALYVDLAPSTCATLHLYSSHDPELEEKFDSLMSRAVRHALQKRGERDALKSRRAFMSKMKSLGETGYLSTTQSVSTIELIHAVERPLAAPLPSQLRVIVGSAEPQTGLPENPDQSVEGGTTAFISGQVSFHGLSTGRLHFDADWDEHGPEGLRKSGGKWSYSPASGRERMFEFEHLDREHDAIAFGKGNQRWPSFSFRDGRARVLRISTTATSAFTDYYRGGAPDRHELSSLQDAVLKVPCTFRPPEPDHWQALPVPRWKSDRRAHREYSFELTWDLRVYLGEKFNASGEGEQIGLVFWRKSGDGSLAQYERDTVGFASVLTQWGNDPIELSGRLPADLPDMGIFSGSAGRAQLLLPPPADPANSGNGAPALAPLEVDVVHFVPRVDREEGPVVDIGINNWDNHRPFLRLGVCRYQSNIIKGLELSNARPRTVVLLPPRRGQVKVSGRKVFVKVWGPGYSDRRVNGDGRLSAPMLRVRLMQYTPLPWPDDSLPEQPMKPAIGVGGKPIVIDTPANLGTSGQVIYDVEQIRLPRPREAQDYAVILEELEFFDGDPEFDWSNSPDAVQLEPSPVISRVTFRRTIDLGLNARDPLDDRDDFRIRSRDVPDADGRSFPSDAYGSLDLDGLSPSARQGLGMLMERYPGLVIVSGRRGPASQARAMAQNIVQDGTWLRRTYRPSAQRAQLEQWLMDNSGAGVAGIAGGFFDIMENWTEAERRSFSLHFAGLAVDLQPVDDPEVERFIEALPRLRKFLRREGGLRRWHLEFEPHEASEVALSSY